MQKLAILGGTFNPVHRGHLLMAEAALKQVDLDQVIWVPTYNPPYRSPSELATFHHRVEMVKLAIAPYPTFTLSTVELDRTGPSYAIDTLSNLQTVYPNSLWYWIIGLDALQSLPRWYRCHELATQCEWLVAPRQRLGEGKWEVGSEKWGIGLRWQWLQMPLVEVSSSLIRQCRRDHYSIKNLVPDMVVPYIVNNNLYL
jgi:nicotinate-nucleotide adenylyltransferase